jgi:hypothetical protein
MSRHTHREITPTRDDDAQPEMTDRYRTMLINDINRVVDDHAPRRYLLSLVHAAYAADNIPIQLIGGRHVTCRDTGVDPGRFSRRYTIARKTSAGIRVYDFLGRRPGTVVDGDPPYTGRRK